LNGAKPDLILNLAFYREQFQLGLQDAQTLEAQRAFEERLIEGCAARQTPLMMLSSARVFDGRKSSAYTEKDEESPAGALGQLQLDLERLLRDRCPQHVILRFSWLLDACPDGPLGQLVDQLKSTRLITLAEEWRGNPTPVADAARVILAVLKQIDCAAPLWGTYHYGSSEATNWIGYVQDVMQELIDAGPAGRRGQLVDQLKATRLITLAEEWRGTPTPVADAARVILSVLKQIDCAAPLWGTYHYGSSEATTWIGFVQYVMQELIGSGQLQADVAIEPAPFETLPALGGRPRNAALLARQLMMVFGIKQRSWRAQMPELLEQLSR